MVRPASNCWTTLTEGGNMDWSNQSAAATRVGEMLALVGATTEYQFG